MSDIKILNDNVLCPQKACGPLVLYCPWKLSFSSDTLPALTNWPLLLNIYLSFQMKSCVCQQNNYCDSSKYVLPHGLVPLLCYAFPPPWHCTSMSLVYISRVVRIIVMALGSPVSQWPGGKAGQEMASGWGRLPGSKGWCPQTCQQSLCHNGVLPGVQGPSLHPHSWDTQTGSSGKETNQ